jgi:hypothetical protein
MIRLPAFRPVPPFARGLVRDLRVRCSATARISRDASPPATS